MKIVSWQKVVYSSVIVLFLILAAQIAADAEVIRQFDADIRLNPDCSLDVVEIIKMDFENSRRHGIFRIIPIEYTRYGGNYSLVFNLVNVTDENNNPLNYEERHMGSDVNIKIGSPYEILSGHHIYCIHYTVRRAVNFFNGNPEVYWNGTGNDWPFRIENANIRFYPPDGVSLNDIKTSCYAGPTGYTTSGEISKGDKYIQFKASNLAPGSGLTMVAQLPATSVIQPSIWQEIVWFFVDWWALIVIPTAACAIIFPILLPRVTDPDGGAIAVEWSPPNDLSPAEVGTLVDENCDMSDIVSTLVDLAARGYLQIIELKSDSFLFFSDRDYEFKKLDTNKSEDVLSAHEQEFLQALFPDGSQTSKLSDLKEKFYIHLPLLRQQIYQSLTDKKLFAENPDTVRWRYRLWAIALFIFGAIAISATGFPSHVAIGWGLIIAGVIILTAAQFMPSRTRKGWKERAECLGFQRFVKMAEKDRIKVLAKDDPTIFGRLLPYAMVLGAADQWAEAFHDLLAQPPSWYVPYGYGSGNYNFSSRNFVNDLGHGMNTMGNTFASRPSSSAGSGGSGFSGGFSGGGFGGGGGGSW